MSVWPEVIPAGWFENKETVTKPIQTELLMETKDRRSKKAQWQERERG